MDDKTVRFMRRRMSEKEARAFWDAMQEQYWEEETGGYGATDNNIGTADLRSAPLGAKPTGIAGDNIVETVAAFVRRFVFLYEKSLYVLVAAWILSTHLHRRFECTGYLFAHSPERQSGKTTLLEVLDHLVHGSTGIQVSPTEAVMFRMAEGRTHLLDEVDSWKNPDDIRSVLNAGYKKGGVVLRSDMSRKTGYKPQTFPVYAPRALAGIGLSILPSATLDRTFSISMMRQKRNEKRERLRGASLRIEAESLKKRIDQWAKENGDQVIAIYESGKFPYLESFSDRKMDIAEPLAAIIEVAYAGCPNADEARKALVSAIAATRREQQSPSREHQLLKTLLRLSEGEDPLVGNASELAAMCGRVDDAPDQRMVFQALQRCGFRTKSQRKNGSQNPLYRYTLSKAALQEQVDRWVADSDAEAVKDGDL